MPEFRCLIYLLPWTKFSFSTVRLLSHMMAEAVSDVVPACVPRGLLPGLWEA